VVTPAARLSSYEKQEFVHLIETVKGLIEQEHAPDGYNVGMNCGMADGQSVMHFHCHVIPRYVGDMEKPKGGVRYCIPEKARGLYAKYRGSLYQTRRYIDIS
jgi:diadenosine tetraphosphate (Ap4A) HIT family hydrolase